MTTDFLLHKLSCPQCGDGDRQWCAEGYRLLTEAMVRREELSRAREVLAKWSDAKKEII